jgi:glycosyltransferase involved in cell wall biosynthesis
MTPQGVSFVVPVHNGARWIRATLESIFAQADGRPFEVIVVDDGGEDGGSQLLAALAEGWPLRIIRGARLGAAAALNSGIRAARFPVICQVDQDVVLDPGWMRLLVACLDDPSVAAAQGYYRHDPEGSLPARVMGLDLEQRYGSIAGLDTDHVCTGNAVYRAEALHRVGLFDTTIGYGYDNDMSYRLRTAGYRLVLCRDARSLHHWRDGLRAFLVQQYGFGYGRLDVVQKHPARYTGDAVSPAAMMAHAGLMLVAVASLVAAIMLSLAHAPWRPFATAGSAIVAALLAERLVAGLRAARRFRDFTPLSFPLFHLLRDLAWVAAIGVWSLRRLASRQRLPSHSMHPRRPARPATGPGIFDGDLQEFRDNPGGHLRVLGLIPAHNERENLPSVIAEIRAIFPTLDLLVVDDGSSDGTTEWLEQHDVRWLRFPERMGIGGAMRAGLRYAVRSGYQAAVRIDGDGQHRPEDIARLLAPIRQGTADVALGSRYTSPGSGHPSAARVAQRVLGACMSALVGGRVTDPTSGFCAVGPGAMRMLAEHHPTGYPEPELRLFLNHHDLSVVEIPVEARSRLTGASSLTPARLTIAGARVLLAMLIVPLRDRRARP